MDELKEKKREKEREKERERERERERGEKSRVESSRGIESASWDTLCCYDWRQIFRSKVKMTTTTTDKVGEEEEKSLGQYDWLIQAQCEFFLVIGPSKKTQSIKRPSSQNEFSWQTNQPNKWFKQVIDKYLMLKKKYIYIHIHMHMYQYH